MKTVGEFTTVDGPLDVMGQLIANDVLQKAQSDEISINDPYFKEFLCVVFSEGNFEFLRVIAKKWYPDERKEPILEFINHVEKMTLEGQEQLRSRNYGSNR